MCLTSLLNNEMCCSTQKMVEINFLCVHKKLRSKRVAPVLIREITRRVNQTGIFQAVYTAGVVLPKPIGTCRSAQYFNTFPKYLLSTDTQKFYAYCLVKIMSTNYFLRCLGRYWHRSLNPKKLIEVKFSHLSRNMTMQRTLKLYKLPDSTRTPGFRKMLPDDIPKAHKLLGQVSVN